MKVSSLKYTILAWVSGFTMFIIFMMPFHAFLTVWLSSHLGHYTALRLWKEALLAVCVLGVLCLLITDHKIRTHTMSRRLVWLILSYIFLNIAWGLLALNQHDVTAKALGYGLIINLRYLVFFLVTWSVALRLARLRTNWKRLVLWPAVVVIILAITQEFLPARFLEHFGYSKFTILPSQFVDNQPSLLRVQSTLRGANPLGAYLTVIISVITALLAKGHLTKRSRILVIIGPASLVALFFTYSRSAWAGTLISVAIILLVTLRSKTRNIGLALGALSIALIVGLGAGFWHNSKVQYTVLHTSENVRPHVTSNGARADSLRNGLNDLAHHSLGNGPGTAGPASVYNNHPPRIAENYFIQIGQETGWLGLFLFLLINLGVGVLLWLRRADPLALSLFASLIGLTFINLLSHAWTDDTLAYVWWGLAGIAMAELPKLEVAKAVTPQKPKAKDAKTK